MRYVVSIILVLLIVSLGIGIVQFKDSLAYYSAKGKIAGFFQYITQFIKVKKHNISLEFSPERTPPITFIEHETKLKLFLSDFFGKFSQSDWQEFWALFYQPIEEEQEGFMVKRYRSQEEVEDYLSYEYPQPFSHFQKQHWSYFWSIVLEK